MAFVYGIVGGTAWPGDSGLTLEPADGAGTATFPDPADGTFDVLCVAPRTRIDAGHTEVLHVTELTGDVWTIEREWWDTTARDIAEGDVLIYSDEFTGGQLLNRAGLDSLPHVYTFMADGTWTAPIDTTYFSVALLGGGGGGAGGQVGNPENGGAGGGGGAWAYMPATSMEPFGDNYEFEVVIGMGGGGGAASADGTDGGATTFATSLGVLLTAGGGIGGLAVGTAGGGGTGSNPDWSLQDNGGAGGGASDSGRTDGLFSTVEFHRSSSGGGGGGWNDGGGTHAGGNGGSSAFTFAAAEDDGESGVSASGAGGGGGGNGGNTTGTDGGNGGIGGGGGGGGGAGGTTAGAGGDGGDGLCFIFAH